MCGSNYCHKDEAASPPGNHAETLLVIIGAVHIEESFVLESLHAEDWPATESDPSDATGA